LFLILAALFFPELVLLLLWIAGVSFSAVWEELVSARRRRRGGI